MAEDPHPTSSDDTAYRSSSPEPSAGQNCTCANCTCADSAPADSGTEKSEAEGSGAEGSGEPALNGRASLVSEPADAVVIVISRVLRGSDWWLHEAQTITALQAQLQTLAEERGLVMAEPGQCETVVGQAGDWARMTCTGTAGP